MAHLAPRTKAEIDRALRAFRSVKGTKYPVGADELAAGLVTAPADPIPTTAPRPAAAAAPTTAVDEDEDDIAAESQEEVDSADAEKARTESSS